MHRIRLTITTLALCGLLAGCNDTDYNQERQARQEALRREAAAMQLAQDERDRREFWQGLTCLAAAGAVVLLVVGAALGSATIRKQTGGPNVRP